jgi:hypothetical protein
VLVYGRRRASARICSGVEAAKLHVIEEAVDTTFFDPVSLQRLSSAVIQTQFRALLCFASLRFALLCFALLCFALLCFALLKCVCLRCTVHRVGQVTQLGRQSVSSQSVTGCCAVVVSLSALASLSAFACYSLPRKLSPMRPLCGMQAAVST